MHPEAVRLADTFIAHFSSADHEIKWLALEEERELWLDEHTVVLGKIDARGLTGDGEPFFGDWKTASKAKARRMDSEKTKWRMNPQALTYGLMLGDWSRRFTVRWALKTEPATCDHEWYTYSAAELAMWRLELLRIAADIRRLRSEAVTPWPLNLHHCTRYGEAYACPFRDEGCFKQNFGFVPLKMHPRTESHLTNENVLRKTNEDPELVVLGATRVGDWMGCHEYYRRMWENALEEDSLALEIGTDFHTLVAANLTLIKESQCLSQ